MPVTFFFIENFILYFCKGHFMDHHFSPGSLVRARGREWTVLPGSSSELCLLRPLAGREGNEETGILTKIEKIEPAEFPFPSLAEAGDASSARLLRDAARLSIRTGVGPFRSFGRISVEPRAYQLVPLILALRQESEAIRLLIADDVGVGKTIEAMLIVRELIDRHEVKRFAVLCPAHLVSQWTKELNDKFHIEAVEVTAKKAVTLEKNCSPGKGIFDEYPFTVVSIDFIKSERNRNEFYAKCPDLLVVDEAHECADSAVGKTQQLRHKLLSDVAKNPKKNILLLTATPHSGKNQAFRSLISILNPKLAEKLPENMSGSENEKLREELANYFVQRRRPDIKKFLGDNLFPERIRNNVTYNLPKLNIDLCTSILAEATQLQEENVGENSNKWRQAQWWSAFTLVLALTSSPKAAYLSLCRRSALKNAKNAEELKKQAHRDIFGSISYEQNENDDSEDESYFLSDEEVPGVSFENEEIDFINNIQLDFEENKTKKKAQIELTATKEPEAKKRGRKKKETVELEEKKIDSLERTIEEEEEFVFSQLSPKQRELALTLKSLTGKKDPKLQNLIHEILIKKCLGKKRNIVIFCRFIDTARYIYDELVIDENIQPFTQKSKLEIRTLTGKNSPEERQMVLKDFQEHIGQRILICTDCLSEGVNLQELFDTVIHYDFAWNPNRHEQREGRVDRLLQKSPEVHIFTLIGKDHPIEEIFLRILHEKQRQIRNALGVHLPITDIGEEILQLALKVKETKKEESQQILLFDDTSASFEANEKAFRLKKLETKIDKVKEEYQKTSRTFYSHSKVTVDDVKKELDAMKQSLGSQEDVERFILTLIERTRGHYVKKDNYIEAQIPDLQLKNRLGSLNKKDYSFKLSFDPNCLAEIDKLVLRTSPEVEDIARTVLETSLDGLIKNHPLKVAARAGVMRTKVVSKRTSVLLGRFRYLLREEKEEESSLVEEILPILFEGSPTDFSQDQITMGESAELILSKAQPDANVTVAERDRFLKPILEAASHLCNELSLWQKEKRMIDILETHRRVRTQGTIRRVRVECVGVPDVLGVYVFLPVVNWN